MSEPLGYDLQTGTFSYQFGGICVSETVEGATFDACSFTQPGELHGEEGTSVRTFADFVLCWEHVANARA